MHAQSLRGADRKVILAGMLVASVLLAGGAGASPALTVRITSAPPATSAAADATFAWVANESAAFTCSLDGSRPAGCGSPKTYTGLTEGLHVFLVTATNTDRAGRTFTARDSHRWIVDLPDAPPPPAPPASGRLVVTVDGGGQVSSAPAGIVCPRDCAHAFALGSSVALTQRPAEGFRFAGWRGACTGRAACAPIISATTLVVAVFETAATVPRVTRPDRDGDRFGAAADACPDSPRGGPSLLRGCTVADFLRGPNGLLHDLAEALALARQRTLRVAAFAAAGRALGAAGTLVERGASVVAGGAPCEGAAEIAKGAGLLDATQTRMRRQIAAMRKAILQRPPRHAFGDAGEKELELAGLDLREGLLRDAAAKAAALRRAYRALCNGLGASIELVGRVAATPDAEGRLQLADGRVVSLAGARVDADDVWSGGRVRIVARRLSDGSWLADSVTSLAAAQAALVPTPCVALRIVPVQDFQQTQLLRHAPAGYRFNGVLRLEAGMRVAASPKCGGAKSGRYSLMIVMSGGGKAYTVAADLDSQDVPVSLPVGGSDTLWSIRVYERYQASNCPPPSSSAVRGTATAAKSFPCPPQLRTKTTYEARILPAGTYGRASYERTVFPLESSAPQITKVQAIYPLHFTIQAGQAGFEAEGYAVGGSPGPRTTITLNEPFALWPDEYYGAPLLFQLATIGVDHYAGLLWPRVVGTRNGKPFRYVATLPRLVKDLLPDCPGGFNCFYRLPWKVGSAIKTAQGNGPGFSHNGKQLYAFDFAMSDGATIYATRGGVVGDLVESNSMNFNPCADNNGNGVAGDAEDQKADGPTNYVRIDHDDGTYSYYAHVRQNSVFPAEDAVVERGDPIASVGNTGRSCGPHLHYQVASDNTNTIYGQTTVICFEGWLLVLPFDLDLLHCYKPVTGDVMFSNNG